MKDSAASKGTCALKYYYIPALLITLPLFACGRPAETAQQKLEPVKVERGEAPPPELLKREESEKIKVKRDKDGSYSWEISGKEVKGIVDADRALRRRLVQETDKEKEQ